MKVENIDISIANVKILNELDGSRFFGIRKELLVVDNDGRIYRVSFVNRVTRAIQLVAGVIFLKASYEQACEHVYFDCMLKDGSTNVDIAHQSIYEVKQGLNNREALAHLDQLKEKVNEHIGRESQIQWLKNQATTLTNYVTPQRVRAACAQALASMMGKTNFEATMAIGATGRDAIRRGPNRAHAASFLTSFGWLLGSAFKASVPQEARALEDFQEPISI